MRRVVVTGFGCVTPVGNSVDSAWRNLIRGTSGIIAMADTKYAALPSRVAGRVQTKSTGTNASNETITSITVNTNAANAESDNDQLDLDAYVPRNDRPHTSRFMHFAFAAAHQALTLANWFPDAIPLRHRTGVCIGSGIGSLDEIADTAANFFNRGFKKVSPYFVPRTLINMAAGNISIRYGFMGPNHSVSTACATGAHAIGDAMRFIKYGDADVMLAGGTEASVSPLSMAGFCRSKSLSTSFNDTPAEACRPFDISRDGFVIGEGAGVLVLEEYEHAKTRGAKMYAEVLGYGLTGDGHHITSPPPDGNGAARAMRRAIETGRLSLDHIDYINAHATSTPLGDLAETRAIKS
ncbi:hypothetical protein HK100_009604, partial [Physocladia obscura]